MSKLAANAPCPCGSGKKAKACCKPVLDGAPASTPEALMRSRYTAWAVADVGHLAATTHPSSPHHTEDLGALRAAARAMTLVGLEVLDRWAEGDVGRVSFVARLADGQTIEERSRFIREHGRWYYVDAEC